MSAIRPAAVAGMFYPDDPDRLIAMVDGLLADASAHAAADDPVPKAIIAPHAGYIYSGSIAASAYVRLRPAAGRISRVVLLGPCHRVAVRGLALPSARAFASPLGAVPVDGAAASEIATLPQVQVFDETHRAEHSLEVHLPFLQRLLPAFSLVPLVAGQATADEVAEVLERLWGGEETLIIVSSDLSHYLPYDAARTMDAATRAAIEHLDPTPIGFEQACGRVPLCGLLLAARRHQLRPRTLDLRNSGDTAGDKQRVVGYGAWMFSPSGRSRTAGAADEKTTATATTDDRRQFAAETEALLAQHGETLLHLAASSVTHGLRCGQSLPVGIADQPGALLQPGASFVTLKRSGQLRGCVGSAQAHRPLAHDVTENAFAAAFHDTRFPPLTAEEIDGLTVSVSLLSAPAAIPFTDEDDLLHRLKPGEDGLILRINSHRALFLPQVWQQLPEPRQFLDQLKLKAGLPAAFWSKDVQAWRFICRSISSDQLADPAGVWA
ncbi:MAG: AmmeMemoRadiSam system protein B [Rhodospirillales bacterium]|nr:AmmeMemoRadiSam system protein B [Rhodospirillales bacterium]